MSQRALILLFREWLCLADLCFSINTWQAAETGHLCALGDEKYRFKNALWVAIKMKKTLCHILAASLIINEKPKHPDAAAPWDSGGSSSQNYYK